ncbi:hypothetical protein O181_088837 [Austropuccinia psidii MF-1]|uniref:Uncharacterized protein n=1 Tax=Austropuccinia psidii MF-1 TaxID=1389203 RepID=A0A9Q3ISF3_9BASI|nr:hypothetical protein [Austropuccinia psidii MF-1]
MGEALLKEVPKLKEWSQVSGEGEYDHRELIRGIEIIKENFELTERLVTERFNNLFSKSEDRWYIKLGYAHGIQSCTWWRTQRINKWTNDALRLKAKTAFESKRLNSKIDRALPWFFQKKRQNNHIIS